MNKLPLITLPLLAVALLTGCGTAGGVFKADPVITPQVSSVLVTNEVSEIMTNPETGATFTNIVLIPATIWTTNLVTNAAYSVSPGLASGIETAKQFTPLIPPPYGTAVDLGLAALAAGLSLAVKLKNRKLASVQDVADLVQPIIAGIEAAGPNATEAKKSVKRFAIAAGVQPQLDAHVQAVSSAMPK